MIALNDRTRLTVLPISDKFSAERKKEQMKSALFFYVFFTHSEYIYTPSG